MRTALFISALIISETIMKAAGKYEPIPEDQARIGACFLIAFIIADIWELLK